MEYIFIRTKISRPNFDYCDIGIMMNGRKAVLQDFGAEDDNGMLEVKETYIVHTVQRCTYAEI